MFPAGAAPNTPDFGSNPPPAFPILPMPRVPRDWFDRLALFEPDQGLYNLVAQCDMHDVTQPQVADSVFGNTLHLPADARHDRGDTAEADELAFQHVDRQPRGDAGVDGVAAGFQHLHPGLRGPVVARHHDMAARHHRRAARPAGAEQAGGVDHSDNTAWRGRPQSAAMAAQRSTSSCSISRSATRRRAAAAMAAW